MLYLAEQAVGVDLQQLSTGVGVPQTDAELVRESFAQGSFTGARRAVKQDHPARLYTVQKAFQMCRRRSQRQQYRSSGSSSSSRQPMIHATMCFCRIQPPLRDLDLPERRKRHASSREEEEIAQCTLVEKQ